jgi:hypothetical protein
MATLFEVFPQFKDLLALEPEELGGVILEIANDADFTIQQLTNPMFPPSATAIRGIATGR